MASDQFGSETIEGIKDGLGSLNFELRTLSLGGRLFAIG